MIHVLTDGIGVQSWTIKNLAERGEITPKPIACVFADTGDEPRSVIDYWNRHKNDFSFPCHRVQKMVLSEQALRVRISKKTGLAYVRHQMPVFMLRSNGKSGMMQRACTMDAKIVPVRNFIRDELLTRPVCRDWSRKYKFELKEFGRSKKEKRPCDFTAWGTMQANALCSLWIGISVDEIDRAKDSVVPWIVNRFPLLELGWNRDKCYSWYDSQGLPRPPKSSCRQCPYHNDDEWIRLRNEEPEEFEKAVRLERDYQKAMAQCPRLDGIPFLHASRKPLDEVQFVPGKPSGSSQSPCNGVCGI